MMNHPTLEKLQQLKFTGMATALAEQMDTADIETFTFEERLGLLSVPDQNSPKVPK